MAANCFAFSASGPKKPRSGPQGQIDETSLVAHLPGFSVRSKKLTLSFVFRNSGTWAVAMAM